MFSLIIIIGLENLIHSVILSLLKYLLLFLMHLFCSMLPKSAQALANSLLTGLFDGLGRLGTSEPCKGQS
jgi:hypothetical protein